MRGGRSTEIRETGGGLEGAGMGVKGAGVEGRVAWIEGLDRGRESGKFGAGN